MAKATPRRDAGLQCQASQEGPTKLHTLTSDEQIISKAMAAICEFHGLDIKQSRIEYLIESESLSFKIKVGIRPIFIRCSVFLEHKNWFDRLSLAVEHLL